MYRAEGEWLGNGFESKASGGTNLGTKEGLGVGLLLRRCRGVGQSHAGMARWAVSMTADEMFLIFFKPFSASA
jgi:hypothetical protein